MIGLWITSILTIFAVGLGHRSSINLKLARFQRDRLKAGLLIKAGIQKAISLLNNDTNEYDSLNETWSTGIDPETKEMLFENVELKKGSKEAFTLRMKDEECRININQVNTDFQKQMLATLFESLGIEDPQGLRDLICDWVDIDPEPADSDRIFKNSNLESPQELMLILEFFYKKKGEPEPLKKAQEEYEIIKDFITVYTEGKININTVSLELLETLTDAVVRQMQAQGITDLPTEAQTQELLNLIFNFREEGKVFTKVNDAVKDLGLEPTDKKAQIINFLIAQDSICVSTQYVRIEASGLINNKAVKKVLIVVKRDEPGKILYWHEN
jgi:type II secretory pathway component PulK